MTRRTERGRRFFRTILAAMALGLVAAGGVRLHADDPPLSVRITSPLGRTGTPGAVRIVARVQPNGDTAIQGVKFFVNGASVGTDDDGPVYAVDWLDDNPFAATVISVEVTDAKGRTATSRVDLAAFDFVEQAEVISVLVEATVHDKTGRPIGGLGKSGFFLEEDGARQELEVVRPEALPATYVMLVDSSQSIARGVTFLRDAVTRFMRYLRPADRVLVVPFSRTLGTATGPTDDVDTVLDALLAVRPGGGTSIYDAIVETSEMMRRREGRHVLVLLSDGYDEHSVATRDDAIRAVQTSGATAYVIGVGGVAGISLKGEALLKSFAEATGGRAFFPYRESELPLVHDRVAADVATRYLLTYTPTNQRVDGSFRAIRLVTADPALVVRTKPGYYAPKPPPFRPTLELTAVDESRRVLDVTREDLVVVEDGIPQTVEAFSEATSPVSIVLALDESGSMRRSAEGVKTAARSFVDALRKEDRLAVLRFSDKAEIAHDLTQFRSDAQKAIDEYSSHGGTALWDAVHESNGRLGAAPGRRVVVVMTDGRDENAAANGPGSVTKYDDLFEELRATGALVYAIGLGTNVDRERLQTLAARSGGEAYFPETVEALSAEYARIVENLRRQYVIGYTSTNSRRDGAWRAVEVTSRQPGVRIASRGGYFAPQR
ncbi:MAG: VWA domain-containing protein [Vicinamibacteraceae bacterium]